MEIIELSEKEIDLLTEYAYEIAPRYTGMSYAQGLRDMLDILQGVTSVEEFTSEE